MEVPFNAAFEAQQKKYNFCYTCEDCVHFDSAAEVCIHEFPNHMHRLKHYTEEPKPANILFCKDFDLG